MRQIEHSAEPAVPYAHDRIYRHHGENRLAKRYHHSRKDLQDSRPVNLGRLRERIRNGFEIRLNQNDVPDGKTAGYDLGQGRVVQSQLHDQQKSGNHAAAEIHGDQQEHGKPFPPYQLFVVEPIGHHRAGDDHQDRIRQYIYNRIEIGAPHSAVLHQHFVGRKVEAFRYGVHSHGAGILR